MSEIEDLRERLKAVIIGTCNTIGCKDCDLKWDGSCSANELEERISAIEFKEFDSEVK